MKKPVLLLLLFFSVAFASCYAGDISFNFYRESQAGGETEKVYGFMYLKLSPNEADNCIYIRVTAPVNQIIEYKTLKTSIYYPGDKQAIVFESIKSQAKINPMDPAMKKIDLGAAGFLLVKKQKQGDGRKETWVPKDRAAVPIKEIVLGMAGSGAITLIEIRDRAGKIMSRMKYADFVKINGRNIPLTVETYSSTGGGEEDQLTKLSKPDDKAVLPAEIQNFKIPAGTETQNVKI
jgi:hypothetical protein